MQADVNRRTAHLSLVLFKVADARSVRACSLPLWRFTAPTPLAAAAALVGKCRDFKTDQKVPVCADVMQMFDEMSGIVRDCCLL